jgi:hypothetical protein
MVYLRTVFRLAETAEGLFGKLATHEVFFLGVWSLRLTRWWYF